jgi:hypothetical protein
VSFREVLDDYAVLYGDRVDSNQPWSWVKHMPGGDGLSSTQHAQIKHAAEELGYIPTIDVDSDTRFARFDDAGVVNGEPQYLPKRLYLDTDEKQFDWLDAEIGGRPQGYTWHHTETPGKMELIPFGIHNVTYHFGGRSPGMWAHAPR